MPKLPSMSSRKLIKLLEKGGAKFVRHGDDVPVIARINLNKRIPVPKEAVAHG